LPPALEARLIGTLGRGCGLLLLVTLAAVWASMVTWSLTDPSLTHATGGPVRNALGAPGAIIADLMIQTLGLSAAVALLPLMIWGIELVFAEQISGLRTKVTYYPLAVLGMAGAVSALPLAASWPIQRGYGGILGDVIFDVTASVLRFVNSESAAIAAVILLGGLGLSALVRALGLNNEGLLRLGTRRSRQSPATQPAQTSWNTHASWNITAHAHEIMPRLDSARGGLMSALGSLGALRPWTLRTPEIHGAHAAEPVLPGTGGFARQRAPEPFRPAYADQDSHNDFYDDGADAFAHNDDATDLSDPALEISSRAIAERFAPANARPIPRDTIPREPQPADQDLPRIVRNAAVRDPAPSSPPKPQESARRAKSGLLRAVTPRRGEPLFKRPAPAMLKRSPPSKAGSEFSQTVLRGTARLLEDVLADFGVKGEVRDIKPGPVVTLYELEPARGTKATRIMALADDIARSMSATSCRVAVIPGRNVIGIELPNSRREMVGLRELVESPAFASADGILPLTLGRSIGGEPVIADLARMPHLLVAGTTGSGKSVGVNAMILSILFRHTPEQCRFLMIDPKMLELSIYDGIPHLLTPVVTDPQKAVGALNWVVAEMEERYKRMAKLSVRNIEAFNGRVKSASERGEQLGRTVQTGFDPATGQPIYEREDMDLAPMAYIVVVVDEFADLMITAGKDIETAVQRLAQKARAAGIHLIMATQRPSVDIITGTIKANFPTRISFKVASKIDSRTILNEQGAEQLLGQGDMLYTSGAGQMLRVHGPFVSDEEVEAVAAYLRTQGAPRYIESIADAQEAASGAEPRGTSGGDDGNDSLYDRAVAVVLRDRKASTSYVQRRLSIGYNRAADLIERMEQEGLISAPNHTGRREILAGDSQSRHA
jgi:S-DNA-T family DNA segregation ATPase FtsK/SpoIIIE